jgi:hypothetical protein
MKTSKMKPWEKSPAERLLIKLKMKNMTQESYKERLTQKLTKKDTKND